MKFFAFNSTDNSFAGWYDSDIHSNIPATTIQVTDDVYHSTLLAMNSGKVATIVNGAIQLVDPPAPTYTWDQIRSKRDSLLKNTDWTQLADVSPTVSNLYKPYRETLRNIPQAFSDPNLVVWPNLPA